MPNYSNIIKELETTVLNMAKKSPLDWFFEFHLKEVVGAAKDLLKEYPQADENTVIIASWLHDLGHLTAKTLAEIDTVKIDHHITGAKMAEKMLENYQLPRETVEKILNCILCHRAKEPHVPQAIEEKIVAVADTLSHFQSIFYLTYFKIYPAESLEEFVAKEKGKIERDWRDLALLPKAQDLARPRYELITQMLADFEKKN